MTVRNSATGPQQHVASQAMSPMFPRLRFGLPNSLVSEVVARRVSEGARRASHDCRRIAHGYLARWHGPPTVAVDRTRQGAESAAAARAHQSELPEYPSG